MPLDNTWFHNPHNICASHSQTYAMTEPAIIEACNTAMGNKRAAKFSVTKAGTVYLAKGKYKKGQKVTAKIRIYAAATALKYKKASRDVTVTFTVK